jgi:hypothetical protein
MQHYSLEYQYSMDITWFVLGKDESIAQFQSGGAILPIAIAQHAEGNETLTKYFEALAPTTEPVFSPYLDQYVDPNQAQIPLAEYGGYASRGLLSFDKINPSPGNHRIDYHLIASPGTALSWGGLPPAIQHLLRLTQQPIDFRDFYKIDAGYRPWSSLFTDFYVEPTRERTTQTKNDWFGWFK